MPTAGKDNRESSSSIDLIGDLHGYADELVRLLEQLGYREQGGVFRHPSRTVIFCGDFIDRGPQIRDVLTIVRSMCEQGAAQAVMGNHEYNAIAWHTERPGQPGEYYRRHTSRNEHQHRATLEQLTETELRSSLEWFRSLPVALDLGHLRVVHACWDSADILLLEQALREHGRWTAALLQRSTDPQHPLFEAVERVLKGPELELPDGLVVRDKEGCARSRIRIRWFEEPGSHSFSSYALPDAGHSELSLRAPEGAFRPAPYPDHAPPVFIGHYWMPPSVPHPLRGNVACLDYSVAKDGYLCAYRFDGESKLRADRFVVVPGRNHKSAPTMAFP